MIGRILASFNTSDALRPQTPYHTALIALTHAALGDFVTGALWSHGLPLEWAGTTTLGLALANEGRQWWLARLRGLIARYKWRLIRDHLRDLAFYALGLGTLIWPAPSAEYSALFWAIAFGMGYEFWRVWKQKGKTT